MYGVVDLCKLSNLEKNTPSWHWIYLCISFTITMLVYRGYGIRIYVITIEVIL